MLELFQVFLHCAEIGHSPVDGPQSEARTPGARRRHQCVPRLRHRIFQQSTAYKAFERDQGPEQNAPCVMSRCFLARIASSCAGRQSACVRGAGCTTASGCPQTWASPRVGRNASQTGQAKMTASGPRLRIVSHICTSFRWLHALHCKTQAEALHK